MFKNCCGCPSKKASRKESKEKEEEDEKKEAETMSGEVVKQKIEETAKIIAQKGVEENPCNTGNIPKKASSMKKPKPRLSISAEVKIIPTNFPDDLEDIPYEEEGESQKETVKEEENEEEGGGGGGVAKEEEEDEDEDDDSESVTISVKNIDGKIIRKSVSEDDPVKPSADGETRTISPLSDEVFVAGEKSHLELPLHNLGVKIQPSTPDATQPVSPKKLATHCQKRVSMPAVLPRWLSEEEETGGTHEPPATPVS